MSFASVNDFEMSFDVIRLHLHDTNRHLARSAESDALVQSFVKANNLRPIRIHDLRHSCATLLLAQGVSPRVVMETLGHSQVWLTLNTYSHVLPAVQEDAASKMDAILSRSYEEAHNRYITWFNWYVHSGASGTDGVTAEALRTIELVARDLIGRFVPEAYRRISVALNAHRALPDFSVTLKELVKKVEVKTFLDLSEPSSK